MFVWSTLSSELTHKQWEKVKVEFPQGDKYLLIIPSPGSQGRMSDSVQPWRWRWRRKGFRGQKSTIKAGDPPPKISPDPCSAVTGEHIYTWANMWAKLRTIHLTYICPPPHSSSPATSFIYLPKSESSCNQTNVFMSQRIYEGNFLAPGQMCSW